MGSKYGIEGLAELEKAFKDLTNMSSSEWKSTLNAAVRKPMTAVKKKAEMNIRVISPGKTPLHRTYLGRMVSSGFASRSLVIVVRVLARARAPRAFALLGVRREAFYAIQFFELGTPALGIPATPWLAPALESSTSTALREVGAAMRQRIERIARKRAARSTSNA